MYGPCHITIKIFNFETIAQKDNNRVQSNKHFAEKRYTKQSECSPKLPDKDFTTKHF